MGIEAEAAPGRPTPARSRSASARRALHLFASGVDALAAVRLHRRALLMSAVPMTGWRIRRKDLEAL